MHTIKAKAERISHDNRVDLGVRIRMGAIARGLVKPSYWDKIYITSSVRGCADVKSRAL